MGSNPKLLRHLALNTTSLCYPTSRIKALGLYPSTIMLKTYYSKPMENPTTHRNAKNDKK